MRPVSLWRAAAGMVLLGAALTAAQAAAPRDGKLLLTGGVSSIDGAGGGGLTPWALIGGYATDDQVGATAFVTVASSRDYGLGVVGVAVGFGDRFELSLAHQDFDTGDNLAPLGLAGLHLRQDIVGAKVRVAGDAVLDADTWMPQVAIGVQAKRARAGAFEPTLTGTLGANRSGADLYVSATKLLLAQGVLVNATLRATKANQNGLLGFGGASGGRYKLQPEMTLAWLLRRDLAVGAEYRTKPDNLDRSALGTGALGEDDWADLFIAWAPNKRFSLTAALVDLGRIVPALQPRRQTAATLSAQFAY